MHHLMIIAVEEDTMEEAIAAADAWMEHADLGDWWEVGGRWSNLLDGKNAISAAENAEVFRATIERMLEHRLNEINELRLTLSGPDDNVALHNPFGVGDIRDETVRERVRAHHQANAAQFQQLLAGREIPGNDMWMTGYYLWKLGQLVAGYCCVEHAVWDAVDTGAEMTATFARAESNPAQQWLVVVDVHT